MRFRLQEILVKWEAMSERYVCSNVMSFNCRFFPDKFVLEVKAVDHPLLRNYVDVVVFSVQGPRRLIDWLAGGTIFQVV